MGVGRKVKGEEELTGEPYDAKTEKEETRTEDGEITDRLRKSNRVWER